MSLDNDYLFTWILYLVGAVGLLIVWWFLTKKIRFKLIKDCLRLSAAVFLLVPFPVYNQPEFWAPALGMSMLEFIFGQSQGLGRAIIPILIIWAFSLAFYLIADSLWQRFRRQRSAAKAEHAALMKEREELLSHSK